MSWGGYSDGPVGLTHSLRRAASQPGGCRVKTYRVYCFDGASRITNAEWIEATNDGEALVAAKQAVDCHRIEVWERDRRVGFYLRGEKAD